MTWAVAAEGDLTRLTVTTAGLRPGSRMDEEFRGGVVYIVSGLKTLVETGVALAAG